MTKYYTLQAVQDFVNSHTNIIENVKITRFEKCNFSPIVGDNFQINFKIITTDEYHNILLRVSTNDSYLVDYYPENDENMTEKEFYQAIKDNIMETMIL